MFKKVCYPLIALISITLLFSLVGCNDLHDQLQGEWAVVPEKTINLEENEDIVKGNKKRVKKDLTEKNYKFIFTDSEMTFRKKDNIAQKSDYKVEFMSNPKMEISTDGESIAITFKNDKTATIDGLNVTLDLLFIRKQ